MSIVSCHICGTENGVTHGDQSWETVICEGCRQELSFCPYGLACRYNSRWPDDVATHLIKKHAWETDKATVWLREAIEEKAFNEEL